MTASVRRCSPAEAGPDLFEQEAGVLQAARALYGADDADAETRKQAEAEAAPIVEKLKSVLGDAVEKVQVGHRLTESPACLVIGDYDMAPHMQRLLREAGHDVPASKPILEINPCNPLVQRFADETDDARSADLGRLLLEEARLAAGDQLDDPAAFIARVNRIALGT